MFWEVDSKAILATRTHAVTSSTSAATASAGTTSSHTQTQTQTQISGSTSRPLDPAQNRESGGMSIAAIAGIAAGGALALLAVAVIGICVFRRRRRSKNEELEMRSDVRPLEPEQYSGSTGEAMGELGNERKDLYAYRDEGGYEVPRGGRGGGDGGREERRGYGDGDGGVASWREEGGGKV